MNLQTTAIVAVFLGLFQLFVTPTDALIQIRYLFNNGTDDPSMSCDSADMKVIDEIFSVRVNRNLRSTKASKLEHRPMDFIHDFALKHDNRRQLIYPPTCKNLCAGYTPRTCRAVNCIGYRRKLLKEDLNCANTTALINADLENNINQLTTSCQSLVNAPRIIECYDNFVFGEITSFTAWKGQANNVALQTNVTKGYKVCRSENVNIEVVGNDCIQHVEMELIRSNGHEKYYMDTTAPFSLVPNNGTFWRGANITVGSYTLVANPNSFTENAQNITFQVLNC
jgi:hypothetical protein